MAITVTIAGTDRSSSYVPGSLSISADIGSRATADFSLVTVDGSLSVALGESIVVASGGSTVFGGSVDRYVEDWPVMDRTSAPKVIDVSAADYTEITDRRLVTAAFTDQFPGDIVKTIRTDYLDTEGITEGTIETGEFQLSTIRFDYQPVADALDDLAELVGFVWRINESKELDFLSRASCPAISFGLDSTSLPVRSLRVSRTRESYRNRQYLRAGKDVVSTADVEAFLGDGENRTFTVALEIAEEPTIEVDTGSGYLSQTVGIRQKDENFAWYWSKGSRQISQDTSGLVLGSTHTLRVTYRGYYPIIVQADDQAEITSRAAAEGGSGLYEHLEDDERIESADLAIDMANGFLRRYGSLPLVLEVETDTPGMILGGIQTIDLTREGVSGSFLVQSLSASDRGDDTLRFRYELIEGDARILWSSFFKSLAAAGHQFVLDENEILIAIRESPESLDIEHSSSATSGSSLASWKLDGYSAGVIGVSSVGGSWTTAAGVTISTGPYITTVESP